jgi:hypothetical protein
LNATTHENTQPNGHAVFHNVGENLYRLESSGGYYALIKKGGKQFRRSLKTKDRKLAERKLQELKEKMGVLRVTQDPHGDFNSMAHRWLDSRMHRLAESTAEWYGYHQPRFGRPALGSDLMEEMRPLVAESTVLSCINNRVVTEKDFVRASSIPRSIERGPVEAA